MGLLATNSITTVMPRTKVTRNRQVTIPWEIASAAHISKGDILEVSFVGGEVVLRKSKSEFPVISVGRKVSDAEIERLIAEAAEEISG